jgi:hypothetical protein
MVSPVSGLTMRMVLALPSGTNTTGWATTIAVVISKAAMLLVNILIIRIAPSIFLLEFLPRF